MDNTRPRRANQRSHKSKPLFRPRNDVQARDDQVNHRILDAKEVLYDDCNPAHPPFDHHLFPGGQDEYVLLRSNTRKTRIGDLFCWWTPEYLWNKGDCVYGLDHPKRQGNLERSSECMSEVLGINANKNGVSTSASNPALLPPSSSKSTTAVGLENAGGNRPRSEYPEGSEEICCLKPSKTGNPLNALEGRAVVKALSPGTNRTLWTSDNLGSFFSDSRTSGIIRSPKSSRSLSSSWIYNPKLAESKARRNSVVAPDIKNNQTGAAQGTSLQEIPGAPQLTLSSSSRRPRSSGSFPNSVPTEPKAMRKFVVAPNAQTSIAQATTMPSNSGYPKPSSSFPNLVPTEPKAMRRSVKVLNSQTNNTTSTARATVLGLSGNTVPIIAPAIPKSTRMPVEAPAPQKEYQIYAEATATRCRMGSPPKRQRSSADDSIQICDLVVENSSTQARYHKMGSPPKKLKVMSANGINPGW